MKAILEFNLYEDREAFELAYRGGKLASAVEDIRNEVFRPARKHGYPPGPILDFIKSKPEDVQEMLEEFVGVLESKFCEILSEMND